MRVTVRRSFKVGPHVGGPFGATPVSTPASSAGRYVVCAIFVPHPSEIPLTASRYQAVRMGRGLVEGWKIVGATRLHQCRGPSSSEPDEKSRGCTEQGEL